MKSVLYLIVFLFTLIGSSQNVESSARKFIDDAQITQINKDWTTMATFTSGIGETVKFFPVEIINLKTMKKIEALQINMDIKKPDVFKTAWVGIDEIEEFVVFIETYVIPNLDMKLKKKSTQYKFKAKEMTLSYHIYEKKTRISIWLNDYEDIEIVNWEFWTETQTKKIPKLLAVLKKIK